MLLVAPAQSHGWHVHRSRAATAAVAPTRVRAAAAAPTRAREDMPFAGLLLLVPELVHVVGLLLLAIVIVVRWLADACVCDAMIVALCLPHSQLGRYPESDSRPEEPPTSDHTLAQRK